jgi:DNA polymerase III alpha subunit
VIGVPLCLVKGLTESLLERIEDGQPFVSVADFQRRAAPSREEGLALLRAGAFDRFGGSRTGLFWELRSAPTTAADGLLPLEVRAVPVPARRTEPDRLQRLRDEMELLRFPAAGHPVELFPEVAWETYCPVGAVRDHAGRRVTTCGLVVARRHHHQSDGRAMQFVSICDRTDILECEIFADANRRSGAVFAQHPVVELTGRVEPLGAGPACVLRVERARPARRRVATPVPCAGSVGLH